MKKRLLVLIIGLAMIMISVFGTACSKQETADQAAGEGEKAYTLEVVSQDGSSKKYEAVTSQEFLKGAMDELSESQDFSYEEDGGMIVAVNGEKAEYSTDKAYWAIYVNDDYGQYGADQQPVTDGDAYKFEYTPAE